MFKKVIVIFAIIALGKCDERSPRTAPLSSILEGFIDPFVTFDKHLTHSHAHHMWPWSQLIRAAAALDLEESLEDPQIISDSEKYQLKLSVKRFKPDELKVKVKNRYIVVEGKHKETDDVKKFMANRFVQRFGLPPGTKQEEVKAVLNEKGILCITAPKHELPPPPPEIEIPITVLIPEKTEKPVVHQVEPLEPVETTTRVKEIEVPSSIAPIEPLDIEATTHVGKIRKKELKTTTKTTKDNEVSKGIEGNGLDYALIESEE